MKASDPMGPRSLNSKHATECGRCLFLAFDVYIFPVLVR